jgi:hypothetical protein
MLWLGILAFSLVGWVGMLDGKMSMLKLWEAQILSIAVI